LNGALEARQCAWSEPATRRGGPPEVQLRTIALDGSPARRGQARRPCIATSASLFGRWSATRLGWHRASMCTRAWRRLGSLLADRRGRVQAAEARRFHDEGARPGEPGPMVDLERVPQPILRPSPEVLLGPQLRGRGCPDRPGDIACVRALKAERRVRAIVTARGCRCDLVGRRAGGTEPSGGEGRQEHPLGEACRLSSGLHRQVA
jgi:hypothetical protein